MSSKSTLIVHLGMIVLLDVWTHDYSSERRHHVSNALFDIDLGNAQGADASGLKGLARSKMRPFGGRNSRRIHRLLSIEM